MKSFQIKAVLVSFLFIVAAFGYYAFDKQREIRAAEQKYEDLVKQVEEEKALLIENNNRRLDSVARSLNGRISDLAEYSDLLTQKLRTNAKTRPNYSLDFLTAFDIISKSDYKPRVGDSLVRQE